MLFLHQSLHLTRSEGTRKDSVLRALDEAQRGELVDLRLRRTVFFCAQKGKAVMNRASAAGLLALA